MWPVPPTFAIYFLSLKNHCNWFIRSFSQLCKGSNTTEKKIFSFSINPSHKPRLEMCMQLHCYFLLLTWGKLHSNFIKKLSVEFVESQIEAVALLVKPHFAKWEKKKHDRKFNSSRLASPVSYSRRIKHFDTVAIFFIWFFGPNPIMVQKKRASSIFLLSHAEFTRISSFIGRIKFHTETRKNVTAIKIASNRAHSLLRSFPPGPPLKSN